MKQNKKVIVKIVSIILAVIVAFVVCFGWYLIYRFNCDKSNATNSYSAVYSQEATKLDVANNGLFRVLKINDTHFFNGTCENDKKTLDELKIILDKTPCDLIVVDGDLVDGFNLKSSYDKYQAIDLFAKLVESYNVPWTFAPGNNDGEIDGDNDDVIAYMMQYDNFVYGNKEGIDGDMHFLLTVSITINLSIRLLLWIVACENQRQSVVISLLVKIKSNG